MAEYVDRYLVQSHKFMGERQLNFCVNVSPQPQNAWLLACWILLRHDVSGRPKFNTAAKKVGRQTLGKQLGSGSRKSSASRVNPKKSAKQTSQSQRDNFTKSFP